MLAKLEKEALVAWMRIRWAADGELSKEEIPRRWLDHLSGYIC